MSSALLLTACGGGGGGGGGGSTSTAPTAVTLNPLLLTSANATSVTSKAVGAQELSSATGGSGIFGGAVVPASSEPIKISLLNLARSQLTRILGLRSTVPVSLTGAVYTQTEPCGSGMGSITVRWNDADENGQVSPGDTFQVSFNGCLSAGATLDGASTLRYLSVTGDPIAPVVPWSVSMSMSFRSLTLTEGSDVLTLQGGMTVSVQTPDGLSFTTSLSANELTATEPAGAETLRNFQYDETYNDNTKAYTWSQSGRLDSTIIGGQVRFETDTMTPFTGSGTANPSTGVMVIRGRDNTSVTLRVIDSTNVDLEVDSDGDSVVDVTINTTWAALAA